MFGARTKVVPPVRTPPAMESAAPSPFLGVPKAERVCANDLCFAIYDSFPVSPGPSSSRMVEPSRPGSRNLRRLHEPANCVAALWRPDRIHPGG